MWDLSRRTPPALQLLILQSPAQAAGGISKGAMLFQLLRAFILRWRSFSEITAGRSRDERLD